MGGKCLGWAGEEAPGCQWPSVTVLAGIWVIPRGVCVGVLVGLHVEVCAPGMVLTAMTHAQGCVAVGDCMRIHTHMCLVVCGRVRVTA